MKSDDYQHYTQALTDRLSSDSRVVGLVAMGSMAGGDRQPDDWSDHDFFVVTQAGTQEDFRQNLQWLPDFERIVMTIRETDHGLKVLYDTPHLVEFAVFDVDELSMAKANDYRVLLDRERVHDRMQAISQPNQAHHPATAPDYDAVRDYTMVLALAYVGTGRYARGEHLSAHVFIKHHLLHHLMPLLIHLGDGDTNKLDNLDAFRRFEQVHPAIGMAIQEALLLPIPACARRLLDIMQNAVATSSKQLDVVAFAEAVATVEQYLHDTDAQI